MNYSVKFINGNKAIKGEHYRFNKETKIFESIKSGLIIDFENYNDITFNVGLKHILKCGDNCIIQCGYENEFYLGKNCLIEDYRGNNIIHSCKSNCQVELYKGYIGNLINRFFIPTNYPIKTNKSNLGFEIVK